MTSWAIVAVPPKGDPVWKLSSEKIPHMTLIFLGEQSSPELKRKISDFLSHVTSSETLTRFYANVSHRGELGDDKADVLFIENGPWLDSIKEFRTNLLLNDDIRSAYDSVEQYPQWTPHVTVGYPNKPANDDAIDHPVNYLTFDQIMFWTEDFGGEVFPLGSQEMNLAHYGVKGMKWGVRKEQRAANKERRSAEKAEKRETKAQKFDKVASKAQSQIDKINSKTDQNFIQRRMNAQSVSDLTKIRDQAQTDAQLKRDGKLTTNQRRVAVAGAAVGAVLLAYGTYKTVDSGELNRLAQKGKSFVNGNKGAPEWKKNDMLSSKVWDADALHHLVVDKINPDYGAPGTKNNCRRATFAYEMRRRGYDVKATKTASGTGQDNLGLLNATTPGGVARNRISLLGKLAKEEYSKSPSKPITDMFDESLVGAGRVPIRDGSGRLDSAIFGKLSELPNGARGELGMHWKMGGGHSMAFEIVKGRPVIFDTQNGKRYSSPEDIATVAANMKEVGFTRLDDVNLNENFLMRWLQDAN